jgi:two-component system CheB/CheR fusion protein
MNGNLQIQVEQMLLKKHAPAAVLLNAHGDILYIHGRTGAYLEPAAGKANWNIHAMARDSLRHEMAELLKRATQESGLIAVRGLIQRDEAGKASQALDLTAEAMPDSGPLPGTVLLTFSSAAAAEEAPHTLQQSLCAGAGTAAGAGAAGDSGRARRDAGLTRGTQVGQRGTAIDQRGTAVHQ